MRAVAHKDSAHSPHFPCALSPESMTASAPSYTALVTSLTSALTKKKKVKYSNRPEKNRRGKRGGGEGGKRRRQVSFR